MSDREVFFCPFCGGKMGENEKFCKNCGHENEFGGVSEKSLFPPAPGNPYSSFEGAKSDSYYEPKPPKKYVPTQDSSDGMSDKTVRSIISCVLCVVCNLIWLFI